MVAWVGRSASKGRTLVVAVLCVLALLGSPYVQAAPAQDSGEPPSSPPPEAPWEEEILGAHPPARRKAVMAPDAKGRVVLFGGAEHSVFNDTWAWDGTADGPRRWENVTPGRDGRSCPGNPCSPDPRHSAAMAYHPGSPGSDPPLLGKTVLFGGTGVNLETSLPLLGTAGPDFDDTWIWDGSNWDEVRFRDGDPRPSPRRGHAMAYHPGTKKVVLFGGFGLAAEGNEKQWLDDTWTFDPAALTDQGEVRPKWENVTPQCEAGASCSPSGRHETALAQDSTGGLVLFGGASGQSFEAHDDTWHWDGTKWKRLSVPPPGPPPARYGHDMAYYASGEVVLFGGISSTDTWSWTGSAWVERSPTASPWVAEENGMAFHVRSQRVVVTGGSQVPQPLGATWTWPGNPALPAIDTNPEPWSDLPEVTYDLVLEPDRIPANGGADFPPPGGKSTATVSMFEGDDPVQGQLFTFENRGDLKISPEECTTGADGTCSVLITSSLTAGEEEVTATPSLGSRVSTGSGVSKILTEWGSFCPAPPPPGAEWWANLDPSFGCNGKVISRLASLSPPGGDMAVDNEGNIVMTTRYLQGADAEQEPRPQEPGSHFYLVRYLPDGELDTSFGVPHPKGDRYGFTPIVGEGGAVKVQPHDGKLLVGGAALRRFNTDGLPDDGSSDDGTVDITPRDGFGTGGKVEGAPLAIQKDRKILAVSETEKETEKEVTT